MPLMASVAARVGTQAEEVADDLYQIVVQHAPSVVFTQEDMSFDKQAVLARITGYFEKLNTGKKRDAELNTAWKNSIKALVALVKDETLLADIQQRIDDGRAMNVLDAWRSICNSDKRPASVMRMHETSKEFLQLANKHLTNTH